MNLVHLQVLDGAVTVWWLLIWWFSGQPTAGTCEIITMDHDSSQPSRTIARQTARCACRKGQIAGTRRASPACVDGETSCGVWLCTAVIYQSLSASPSPSLPLLSSIIIHRWDLQAVKVCELISWWCLHFFLSSYHLAPSLVWHDSLFRWWTLWPPGQSVGLELHTARRPSQENDGKMRIWRGTSFSIFKQFIPKQICTWQQSLYVSSYFRFNVEFQFILPATVAVGDGFSCWSLTQLMSSRSSWQQQERCNTSWLDNTYSPG